MELESYIREKQREKGLLLMTHIVMGYPSFEQCYQIVEKMVRAGADLMELQIPFSEPIADGPTILRANQVALENGVGIIKCLELAAEITRNFNIPFLVMTYFNIIFKYGVSRFVEQMAKKGVKGAIVADLPPEEAHDYLKAMEAQGLAPIFLFSPTTSYDRMRYIGSMGKGFVYCVARKGVTGAKTDFSEALEKYLQRCRMATTLPLAVGFGVKSREDVAFLKQKADIAVIGSQLIRVFEKSGINQMGAFLRSLR